MTLNLLSSDHPATTLWKFLSSQSDVSFARVAFIAGVSGLANAVLLAIINSAAHAVSTETMNVQLFLMFFVAITLYIVSQRYILRVSSTEVEKVIARVRVSVADKIRNADLQAIEGLGRARIFASMTTDTLTISQATAPMIIACQGAILVAFSLVYMFVLSPTAFYLTIVIVALGVMVHFKNRKELHAEITRSTAKEEEFFEALTHLLEGFKEVKLNAARGRELFEHLKRIAGAAREMKTKTGVRYADYYIFTQVLFYLLIGAMVFILPGLSKVYSAQVARLTAAILFIIGPLTMVVGAFPVFRMATHAVEQIACLEADLGQAQNAASATAKGNGVVPAFSTIAVKDLVFSYPDQEGRPLFTVGPMSLTLTRGEILLLVGGNGSGKSTFLKLLTGLYYPTSGVIALDGMDVRTIGLKSFRQLFSAIFSDYHLFDRLYGLAVEDRQVVDLLKLMQLEQKTFWQDGRFENQDLSTGQRKRLALIVSLLEDKPIYVFDEWAADQDPSFRQFFYETLLPEMKTRGKTIVAATHDDRYYHVGDRVLKMEAGRFAGPGGDA